MTYADGRLIHDADSHIMELPDMLAEYADPDIRSKLEQFDFADSTGGAGAVIDEARRRHGDPKMWPERLVESNH